MAFANPLVVSINSVNKSLAKINQDGYASEYLLKEATQEFRVKIRNTTESSQRDGRVFDRHNVEITQTVYATSDTPSVVRVYSATLRCEKDDDLDALKYLVAGLHGVLSATAVGDLYGWQS